MLEFRISLKDKPMIRRVVLSIIGSIYVALSLVALFLRTDETLLQRLFGSGMDWIVDIDGEDRALCK